MAQIEQGSVYFSLSPYGAWQAVNGSAAPSGISNQQFSQWLSSLFGLSVNGTPLPVGTVGLTTDPVLGITDSLAQLLLATGVELYTEDGLSALPTSFSVEFLTIAPLPGQAGWDSSSAIFTPTLDLILAGQLIEYSVEFNFVGLDPTFSGSYPFFNVALPLDRAGLYSNIQDQASFASYLSSLGLNQGQIQTRLSAFVAGLADNVYAVSTGNALNLLAAYQQDLATSGSSVVLYSDIVALQPNYIFPVEFNNYQLYQGSILEENGSAYLYIQSETNDYIVIDKGTASFVKKDFGNVVSGEYGNWFARSAEIVSQNPSSVNQMLWSQGVTGDAAVWSLDVDWAYAGETAAEKIGYGTLDWEFTFDYDLNGDGAIGQSYVSVQTSYSNRLYTGDVLGYQNQVYLYGQIYGTSNKVNVIKGGGDYESTIAGWSAVSGINSSATVNQILWTQGVGGSAVVWSLDEDWVYLDEGPTLQIGSATQALEKTFYYDLDGLNGISDPVADGVTRTTVQSSSTTITGSGTDEFYIALAASGSVTVTGGGGSDAYQLYTSAGVQFVSAGSNDYMAITDFSPNDKIVLLGDESDYSILNSGASLYYVSGGSSDLIATITGSALNSSQLVYTTL